jgi:hypothetical protein
LPIRNERQHRAVVQAQQLNINPNPFSPHAVKEFLEKCKSEFEEKWNHPKHVSLISFSLFQFKTS